MSLVNLDIFYIIAKNSILVTLQVYFPNAPGEKKKNYLFHDVEFH